MLQTPPPLAVAVLPLMVELVMVVSFRAGEVGVGIDAAALDRRLELPLMVEPLIVRVPLRLAMPPPLLPWLALMVEPLIARVPPSLKMPPPLKAEFPLMVEPVIVRVPPLRMPPPTC